MSYDFTFRQSESTTKIVFPLQPVASTQCCPLFTLIITRQPTSRFILSKVLGTLPSKITPNALMEAHTKSSLFRQPLLFLSQVFSEEGFWLMPMPDNPIAAADTRAPTWQMVLVEVPNFSSFHLGSHWLYCGQSRARAIQSARKRQSSLCMVIKLLQIQTIQNPPTPPTAAAPPRHPPLLISTSLRSYPPLPTSKPPKWQFVCASTIPVFFGLKLLSLPKDIDLMQISIDQDENRDQIKRRPLQKIYRLHQILFHLLAKPLFMNFKTIIMESYRHRSILSLRKKCPPPSREGLDGEDAFIVGEEYGQTIQLQSNKQLHKMERTANCGFFSCGQQQRGLQEAAQEQLSSNYCLQRTNKTPKPPHPPLPLPSQHHQIFSFRLNSFRSTNPSHQPNPLPLQTLVETPTKLLNFRSCQKAPPIMHENPARPRQTQRIFRSPPPNLQMQLLRQQRSPEVKRSMMLPSSYQQQNVRITFTTPMEENQSQVDGYSKHSEHTHYTSKKSDIHLSSQAKGFSNENEVDFGDRWTFIADKCPTQKSCIFGNGGETQRTLIDYLNEDQPPQNIDEQLNNRHYDYTPHPYSNPTANYSPILEHQALRSHHQTVTVRTKPTTVHAIPYRINV